MSEVRKRTFRNTKNDDNKHKLFNMTLHMNWDYIRFKKTKRKIKTRTKRNKEWLFSYLNQHNFICIKFSKNFINITLIYLIKKGLGNNFNTFEVNNMQTKPWCSPMKSKTFCFIVMFTLVMVQPWNLEFAVSIWCLWRNY